MLFAQSAATLLILSVCAFAPGFFVVRRLRWSPLEKLCGSVGLSLILVWLMAWAMYLFVPHAGMAGSLAITALCAALGIVAWSDIRTLFGNLRVRHAASGFAFLLLWALVLLATIRHYSGAGWTGDWLEHFHRSLVYLYHLPNDTVIFGGYRIPSRPPLAHLLAAFVMSQTQDRFEIFQLTFAFFNLLLFLPCCLILPLLARPWKSGILPLAGIFAMSPLVMINATYTGTKPLSAGFVVLAIAFYLRGWKKHDRLRISAAFLAIAVGVLAHYSAIPYAIFLAGHYLVAVFPSRPQRWKELAAIAVAAAVPLLAWFGWCAMSFGLRGTVAAAANTSVAYQAPQDSYFLKSLANLFDSLVPHVVRDSALVQAWYQPNTWGYIRDNAFTVYQTSLIFTMGIIGGPLVIWLLIRVFLRRRGAGRTFWLLLIPCALAANIALVGERDHYGIAHITMISMLVLGLTFLAANFASRRAVSLLILAGCLADFSLGIFLQARIEHLEVTPGRMPFARIMLGKIWLNLAPPGPDTLSRTAGLNWFRKHQYALSQQWLRYDRGLDEKQAAAREELTRTIQDDQKQWNGWFKNHGGELVFFGDHFGDTDWTSFILVIGCAAVLWKMSRYAPPPAKVALPAAAAPPRPKAARRQGKR